MLPTAIAHVRELSFRYQALDLLDVTVLRNPLAYNQPRGELKQNKE